MISWDQWCKTLLWSHCNRHISSAFCLIFVFSIQLAVKVQNKICRWLDSNLGHLDLEKTEPQPFVNLAVIYLSVNRWPQTLVYSIGPWCRRSSSQFAISKWRGGKNLFRRQPWPQSLTIEFLKWANPGFFFVFLQNNFLIFKVMGTKFARKRFTYF